MIEHIQKRLNELYLERQLIRSSDSFSIDRLTINSALITELQNLLKPELIRDFKISQIF